MKKKQKRTIGSIVKVPVDDYFIYAQILDNTEMVFFDTKNLENENINQIVEFPVLFRVATNDNYILDGTWEKIGKSEIKKEFLQPVPYFIQDALNPDKFEIYLNGNIRPATKKECLELDRCAVWAVNHIEDRIRDHYNNKPNAWVEQMKLKS